VGAFHDEAKEVQSVQGFYLYAGCRVRNATATYLRCITETVAAVPYMDPSLTAPDFDDIVVEIASVPSRALKKPIVVRRQTWELAVSLGQSVYSGQPWVCRTVSYRFLKFHELSELGIPQKSCIKFMRTTGVQEEVPLTMEAILPILYAAAAEKNATRAEAMAMQPFLSSIAAMKKDDAAVGAMAMSEAMTAAKEVTGGEGDRGQSRVQGLV